MTSTSVVVFGHQWKKTKTLADTSLWTALRQVARVYSVSNLKRFDSYFLRDGAMAAIVNSSPRLTGRRFWWLLAIVGIVSSVIGITAFAQIKRSSKGEVWSITKVIAKYPHDA